MFTFGNFPLQAEGRIFVLSDSDFENRNQPIDISEVYLDANTCDPYLVERFITFMAQYLPKYGLESVQIYYRGELDDLGENLKNALRNTFVQIEKNTM